MTQAASGDRRRVVLLLVEQYEGRLTRYAARLLGDEDAARDAVQHAFLRLCDQESVEADDRTAAWLFTVCRNRAVDLLRSRRRAGPLDQAEACNCGGREPDPAALAEAKDLHARIGQVMCSLPEAQREAIDLWARGLGYREIARIGGTSEGNVRVLVHRALKWLRTNPTMRQLLDMPEENSSSSPGPAGRTAR